MQLRSDQEDVEARIYDAWRRGAKNVAPVMCTGSGKTQLFSKMIGDHQSGAVAIAHRKELVNQISTTLGMWGVRHQVLAQRDTVRSIVDNHRRKLGENFVRVNTNVIVASVDTLNNQASALKGLIPQVKLVVIDEAHHVLRDNKWGQAFSLFPNAKGLLPTATPERGDGRGLARSADGLLDEMVLGLSMRETINRGNLCDYIIYAPRSDFDLRGVKKDAGTGDYNKKQLRAALEKSKITGDIVESYKKFAYGKRGITFCDCVMSAEVVADKYRRAGIPALVVDAGTKSSIREQATRDLESGKLWQLVNVDLFGEGYDVPCVEVVSFGRPTASYGLYVQQFGRVLRTAPGKTHGIVIDHVGNVEAHLVPDAPREWNLHGRSSRSSDASLLYTTCLGCAHLVHRYKTECPNCGEALTNARKVDLRTGRSPIETVDGDLELLSDDILRAMRGEIHRVDSPWTEPARSPKDIVLQRRHMERQAAQAMIRPAMGWWAAYTQQQGLTPRESAKLFYLQFGLSVPEAQALGGKAAQDLLGRIYKDTGDLWRRCAG